MKNFKKALLSSLILHLSFFGLLSFQFSEKKQTSLVRVRLVSISQAGLHNFSSSDSSVKLTKATRVSKKEISSPAKIQTSKPKAHLQKNLQTDLQPHFQKKASFPSRASKTEVSEANLSSGKKNSLSFPLEITSGEEERLKERLAALQLKQKLEKLREKVASEKGEGEGVGAPSRNYSDLVRIRLHQFFEVPLSLKSQKDLAAIVEIRLGASGKLLSYRLIKSSGNLLLDRVVEATVRAADPYPPPGKPVTIKAIFTPEGINSS